MHKLDFASRFTFLTRQDSDPLNWQIRLFEDWFANGEIPDVIASRLGWAKRWLWRFGSLHEKRTLSFRGD